MYRLTAVDRHNADRHPQMTLPAVGRATDVAVAYRRTDGTLSPYVTIWGVRSGDDIYIRSAYGPGNGRYRRVIQRPRME